MTSSTSSISSYDNQMEITGVILAKDRSYYPRTRNNVKAVFYFKSNSFFNVFFQRTLLNRLDENTQVIFVTQAIHASLLSTWSASTQVDDTIFDNMLPYPNTKNYAWDCNELSSLINTIRKDHSRTNRSGRPYYRPEIKSKMKDHLMNVDHYTIEMTAETLSTHMTKSNLQFSHEFSMPKGIRSSLISNTDYSEERLSGDIIGAIRKFTEVTSLSLNAPKPVSPPSRPSTPYPRKIQEIYDNNSSESEDDAEFTIRSSHPAFINDDGTEVPTSPYPTRMSKRQRSSTLSTPMKSLPSIQTPDINPFSQTPLSPGLSSPFLRESSLHFTPFSPSNITF